jgi:nuclear cap-binding protein subunit 1
MACVYFFALVSQGVFRVTEQPYKIPFYAALLRLLHDPAEDSTSADTPSLGKQILEDFWKGFQAFLDKLAWREARLCVSRKFCGMLRYFTSRVRSLHAQIHFFSHLTMAKVISVESMFLLLQSFTAVLDEFGVSHGRGKKAALCAAEGLMIVHFLSFQTRIVPSHLK